ncbi:MAG: hypothetical protein AB7V14_00565 [Kiritimatiellia bacterium]
MRPELRASIELALQAAHATPEERRQIFAAADADAPAREKLVTSKIAAVELDSCVATLFRYEKAGKLHAIRRSQRSIRWRLSEILKLKMEGV